MKWRRLIMRASLRRERPGRNVQNVPRSAVFEYHGALRINPLIALNDQ
jgi:hypothetical protein